MLRRCLVLGLASLPILIAAPASAKMPPFTIEMSSRTPHIGQTVLITVRFWNDVEHTERARWPDIGAFREFLWAQPIGRDGVDAIPIDVQIVRPGVYRGRVVLPSAGKWKLCSWAACRADTRMLGYPTRPESLVVVPLPPGPSVTVPRATPSQPRSGVPLPLVAAAAVLSSVAVVARLARNRRS